MIRLRYVLTALIFSIGFTGCLHDDPEDSVEPTPNKMLYNIDFESPTHTVGLAPTTGDGEVPRETVSAGIVGTPLIIANFGAVNSQSLQFDSSDNQGDQISLSLNGLPSSNIYCFETDIMVSSVVDFTQPFSILFDTPQIRRINFKSDGKIEPFVPLQAAATSGDYSFDVEINIKVEINLDVDRWDVYADNILMHTGGFGGATALDTIRLATPVIANPATVIASVDNVLVSSENCIID